MPYTRTVPDPAALACPAWCPSDTNEPGGFCAEGIHCGPEAAFPLSLHDRRHDCRVYPYQGVGQIPRVQVARGDMAEDDPILMLTGAEARALAAALLEQAELLEASGG